MRYNLALFGVKVCKDSPFKVEFSVLFKGISCAVKKDLI